MPTRTLTLDELERRAWHRAKRRAGYCALDPSPWSYERALSNARAWRLWCRLSGERISLYQALKG